MSAQSEFGCKCDTNIPGNEDLFYLLGQDDVSSAHLPRVVRQHDGAAISKAALLFRAIFYDFALEIWKSSLYLWRF